MTTCRALSIAAAASILAAAAQAPTPLTYRQIREMPPAAVALRLLSPDQAADVDRIETQPNWGMLPGALQVRFFHRPVPVGGNYCSQSRHEVVLFTTPSTRDVPLDAALRVQSVSENTTLARAPACRLGEGQQFADILSGTDEAAAAMRALDDLAAAQAAAGARGRSLPFQLSCRDEVERDPDNCRPTARVVLARLPLQRACSAYPDEDDPRTMEVTLCTDRSLWTLRLRDFGTSRARLSMLWKDPPPF